MLALADVDISGLPRALAMQSPPVNTARCEICDGHLIGCRGTYVSRPGAVHPFAGFNLRINAELSLSLSLFLNLTLT